MPPDGQGVHAHVYRAENGDAPLRRPAISQAAPPHPTPIPLPAHDAVRPGTPAEKKKDDHLSVPAVKLTKAPKHHAHPPRTRLKPQPTSAPGVPPYLAPSLLQGPGRACPGITDHRTAPASGQNPPPRPSSPIPVPSVHTTYTAKSTVRIYHIRCSKNTQKRRGTKQLQPTSILRHN